ncbi:hypothetical protein CA951_03325 [Rhodococcus sp. NCIMB 12038]|nr:hypothetical protein CA951_03325 [Rhodococcus sp. NCIMB 12038]
MSTRRVPRGEHATALSHPLRPREPSVKNCVNCGFQIVYRERDFRWVHTGTSNQTSGHLCWPGVSEDVATAESDE